MAVIDHLIGRAGLIAGVGILNPQQVGRRLTTQIPLLFLATDHGIFVGHFKFGEQPTAAQVHQFAAPFIDPVLHLIVHRFGPIFRVSIEHQHLVVIEVDPAKVELGLGIEIIGEALALQPTQEPPLRRCHRRFEPPFDGVGNLGILRHTVKTFRAVKRKRGRTHIKGPDRRRGITL